MLVAFQISMPVAASIIFFLSAYVPCLLPTLISHNGLMPTTGLFGKPIIFYLQRKTIQQHIGLDEKNPNQIGLSNVLQTQLNEFEEISHNSSFHEKKKHT